MNNIHTYSSYIVPPTNHTNLHMRLPSFPSIVRTVYAFTNTTLHRVAPSQLTLGAAPRQGVALRASMPTIPFLGALFSTAENRKMSFPVEKSDQEWKAVLNKGEQTDTITRRARYEIN